MRRAWSKSEQEPSLRGWHAQKSALAEISADDCWELLEVVDRC
jgi:hypothetical protein